MSKAALLELADRVEKASGPDRELDGKIKLAYAAALFAAGASKDDAVRVLGGDLYADAKPYTSSLDAAMTLVPEGWWLTLDRYSISDVPEHQQRNWRVWLKLLAGDVDGDGPCGLVEKFAIGRTPALVLTAACLRARAN